MESSPKWRLADHRLDFALRPSETPAMRKSAAVLAVLLLAGCQSAPRYTIQPPPYAPPPPPPQQQQQGRNVPPRPTRPVPNYTGTAGPLAPAGVGRYMDGIETDLRRILRGVPVARPGDLIALNLRDDALFRKGGGLSDDGRDVLKQLAAALRHYDHTLIQVNGYTDTRDTPDEALKLSQKRADEVAGELRTDGVDMHRLTAQGFGRTHLKIATGEGVSEARNRRIEIRIVPKPG
jgi:outer membrane protein OmpA-like peptidoglycan-associated protein